MLEVFVDFGDICKKKDVMKQRFIRGYAISSQRQYRSVVKVAIKEEGETEYRYDFKLPLIPPGDKAPDQSPYFFHLARKGADQFELRLIQKGEKEPQVVYDEALVAGNHAQLLTMLRKGLNVSEFLTENFGDDAYLYRKMFEEEVICVGDVVAMIRSSNSQEVFVTKDPTGLSEEVIEWGVVANAPFVQGYVPEFPKVAKLRDPLHCGQAFAVPVARHGIVAVMLTESSVGRAMSGMWAEASGDGGFACVQREGELQDDRKQLGKLRCVIQGTSWAILEVNFRFRTVHVASAPWTEASDLALQDVMVKAKEVLSVKDRVQLMKKGLKKHPASVRGRAILLFELGQMYAEADELGNNWKKATNYGKQAAALSQSEDVLAFLARCYLKRGKIDKALKTLDQALALAPYREDFSLLMVEIFFFIYFFFLMIAFEGGDS